MIKRSFLPIALLDCLLLSGCAQPAIKPICPQIVSWTEDFQHQAAAEMRGNPGLVALPEIVRQDVVLRDQARACQKGK